MGFFGWLVGVLYIYIFIYTHTYMYVFSIFDPYSLHVVFLEKLETIHKFCSNAMVYQKNPTNPWS